MQIHQVGFQTNPATSDDRPADGWAFARRSTAINALRIVAVVTTLAIAPSCSRGSSEQSSATGVISRSGSVNVSTPDRLVQLFNSQDANRADFAAAWSELGLIPGPFSDWPDFAQDVSQLRLTESLSSVRLCIGWTCRFLVFRRVEERWSFLGASGDVIAKYDFARSKMIERGDRQWMIVESEAAGGNGISLKQIDWYEIRSTGVRRVLRYTGDGNLGTPSEKPLPGDFRDVETTLVDINDGGRGLRVRVRFRCAFGSFAVQRVATFAEGADGMFALAPDSEVSEEELAAVFGLNALSSELFFRLYVKELQQFARSNNGGREWLRQVVQFCEAQSECPETKEKALVRDLLN
jgi:hypothetical protein